jgi:hypothetical protein
MIIVSYITYTSPFHDGPPTIADEMNTLKVQMTPRQVREQRRRAERERLRASKLQLPPLRATTVALATPNTGTSAGAAAAAADHARSKSAAV